jgi:Holliday junction resolvase RusA-like endonuclease
MKYIIRIPLKPMAKQSFRGAIYTKDGKALTKNNRVVIRAYQPAKLVKWKTDCSFIIYSEMKKKNIPIFTGPVYLKIIFNFRPPKSLAKKYYFKALPDTRPDLDNLEKMLNDACSKILFRDDAQITRKEVYKRYIWDDSLPYILLSIEEDKEAL